ncbi:hypothetical protein QT970_14810 [Microcoleus sp. herbarium8]|uniref:hypothetical protein n=1 Tax=Microcoleus sp. herbarium8 TaxID=3055436 RepID=UPI002FD099F1
MISKDCWLIQKKVKPNIPQSGQKNYSSSFISCVILVGETPMRGDRDRVPQG